MRITINKNMVEGKGVSLANEVYDEMVDFGIAPKKDKPLSLEVKDVTYMKGLCIDAHYKREGCDLEYIALDVSDDLIMDILKIYVKVFKRFLPMISLFKGCIPMIKNIIKNTEVDMKEFDDKWGIEYTYGVFKIADSKFYKNISVLARTADSKKWDIIEIRYGISKDDAVAHDDILREAALKYTQNMIETLLKDGNPCDDNNDITHTKYYKFKDAINAFNALAQSEEK